MPNFSTWIQIQECSSGKQLKTRYHPPHPNPHPVPKICLSMWKSTDGETPAFKTAAFLMYILTLTNYQNKSIQLVTFFIFHFFFCLGKYQVLIKLATFVWGFQLSKVTSPTAINFFARVSNTVPYYYSWRFWI